MDTLADQITSALGVLIGQPFSICGRAADMQFFGFGPLRPTTDRKGRATVVSSFHLHIQSRWRFVDADRILFGRDDLLFPADAVISIDEFDWDVQDSLLDVTVRDWMDRHRVAPPRVIAATGDPYGGFRVELEGRFALECFPCLTRPRGEYSEHWRLLTPRSDLPHFVVTTHGIDSEADQ